MALRTMIIDDEPFARADLIHLLSPYDSIRIAGEAESVSEAKNQLSADRFDLIFLDTRLKGRSVFDLMPFIHPLTQIVFVTDHAQYAIQAFELNAVDYILKPVSRERLFKTILRVESGRDAPGAGSVECLIPVRMNSSLKFIARHEIVCIRSMGGNYNCLHLKNNEKLVCRKTLKAWESCLPASGFLRIHRSTIINTGYIRCISQEKNNVLVSLLGYHKSLAVSRRMVSRLKTQASRHVFHGTRAPLNQLRNRR